MTAWNGRVGQVVKRSCHLEVTLLSGTCVGRVVIRVLGAWHEED